MKTHFTFNRIPFRIVLPAALAIAVGLLELMSALARQAPRPPEPAAAPWGISSSAGSMRDVAEWFPKMSAAGVTTVRLFPEWRDFEPTKGTWKWERADAMVEAAAKNKIEINAILMGSSPGDKKVHAFPMDTLDGWSNFVSTVVDRYKNRIHCWEVWNEGNGGFNDGKHTTTDYAKLAVATYAAAKKADPHAKVGLTVASFDAPYLNQAILAMAKAGKPNSFDYLCIHPYEIADHLGDADGEIPFLWMTRLLRDMLKASAPERAGAEIWITEVARRVEKRKGHVVTEEDAAKALAKIYTMALAQGIARTQWLEAQDPVGEDQGFGLLARDRAARTSYGTFKTLTTHLGPTPKYLGWLALGKQGRGYGFVFQGKSGPILVAWMPAKSQESGVRGQESEVVFTSGVTVIDSLSGAGNVYRASQPFTLTDTPVLVMNVPAELLKQAHANAAKNFPWGGDYSAAKAVHCEPGVTDGNRGIFPVQRSANPTVQFADGSTGILSRGDIGQAVSFFVHPSFASFQSKEYFIRVHVRRVAPGNVGMNLNYEVADSQGRTPYKNRGQWFGLTADDGWQTYTWHVTDACFSKMWGYDFSLRPEQSVPFVIGKVEVSTVPFK
jgi:hypothetical protein